ncbi:bZIP transcription factor 53-like [Solanum stenotomum]|uniref:bZIP transcription factor 53-like n=1 Tax=Solanum stenotomum TaxID=172797 RepID=UPI0020D01D4D|nr:bZIP transcription factor 53-like [Solanum stenotomum]
MSPLRQSASSSASDDDQRYAGMDEKKRKRMISNRESARRSRMKKQKLLQDLTGEVNRLQSANKNIVSKIDETTERYAICAAQNNVLRAQAMELTDRLRYLNDVIDSTGLAAGVADPLLKPLQNPCPMQPIASSGLFKF